MTPEEGIKQIDEAQWERDEFRTLHLYITHPKGGPVDAWLSLRPVYCDRGHIQLNIDGPLELDAADRFPRFFFSFEEADAHTRAFLKWRLWKHRMQPHAEIRGVFLTNYQTLVARVADAFGDEVKASRWLSIPNPDLNGETPLQVAQRDDYSALALEPILVRIEHGIEDGPTGTGGAV